MLNINPIEKETKFFHFSFMYQTYLKQKIKTNIPFRQVNNKD